MLQVGMQLTFMRLDDGVSVGSGYWPKEAIVEGIDLHVENRLLAKKFRKSRCADGRTTNREQWKPRSHIVKRTLTLQS